MASAQTQTRLEKAVVAAEQADAEVERLCDILERAADALRNARETKRAAQRELDEAAHAAKAAAATSPRSEATSGTPAPVELISPDQHGGERHAPNVPVNGREEDRRVDEPQSDYSDEESDEYSGSDSEESDSEEEEMEDEEEDGFEMGNEALEQIRYRLQTAKIDPNSPDGTKILDELLVRLQNSNEEVIDARLVNIFIDELFFETEERDSPKEAADAPPQNEQGHPRVRINRGGKVLGWYQGQLDERGYARKGRGSMYYDAGHECHGTWENDEMVGRGIYQWADGHVYDGEWRNGKRHGLGRFVRPDDVVLYGRYELGHHKGEGVRWSADRREAQMVVDGVPTKSLSLDVAKKIATDLGFDDVLPPV